MNDMEQDGGQWVEMLNRRYRRFIDALRDNDANSAAEDFAHVCRMLRRSDLRVSQRVMIAFMEGWIDLFWQSRNHEQMLKAAEDARVIFGPDPAWDFARGEALFFLGQFKESYESLFPLTTEDFDDPMLYYLLACLAERKGQDEDALRLFTAAHKLDPENFQIPVMGMSEDEARACFERCLDELPESIARQVRQVPIYISPLPTEELILSEKPVLEPLTLGLFMGQPHGAGESPWPDDQPRILLFHRNIAKVAPDFETLDEELRKTLFHEVGHYLGFDEDQLDEMGLA